MSTFKYWTREKLQKRFGLQRIYNHTELSQWLQSEMEIDDYESKTLKRLLDKLIKYVDYWNEEELKIKFIGNMISLVDFDTDQISAFANRYIGGVVDGEELSGEPNLMIASGKQEVYAPFFFLHEYKKELDNDSPDPAGQCLASMLLAYHLNLETPQMANKTILGAYIIGRNWFFMVLDAQKNTVLALLMMQHKKKI
ncbi:MAG: hypothetical protein H7A23_12475 [Leptospiraceae bacterium]|nr:hypothetical protein [Leptospiraceae bacterium]MCP5495364.1 hypothetical protein [Leptospiraceae bacterium]